MTHPTELHLPVDADNSVDNDHLSKAMEPTGDQRAPITNIENIAHLEHMAAVRPGRDGETSRWAAAEIERLNEVVKEQLEIICDLFRDNRKRDRLDGAAPDMLAALKAVETIFPKDKPPPIAKTASRNWALFEQVRAAIAKATGAEGRQP